MSEGEGEGEGGKGRGRERGRKREREREREREGEFVPVAIKEGQGTTEGWSRDTQQHSLGHNPTPAILRERGEKRE